MKFQEALIAAIQRSEIPLRFEPGAEESVAQPVAELLRVWIAAHLPDTAKTDYDRGYRALALDLLAELEGTADLPEVR